MNSGDAKFYFSTRIFTIAEGEGIAFGSVCPSVRTELSHFPPQLLVELRQHFHHGATTHVECSNDNYDIIGHMVWQPCWKNGKTLDLCISETAQRK